MNKKIVYSFILAGLLCLSSPVLAQVKLQNPLKGIEDFPTLLSTIADAITPIVASLALLMLIIAGIFFLLSAGKPEMLTMAKQALSYAIIGAAIGLAAAGLVALLKKIIGA